MSRGTSPSPDTGRFTLPLPRGERAFAPMSPHDAETRLREGRLLDVAVPGLEEQSWALFALDPGQRFFAVADLEGDRAPEGAVEVEEMALVQLGDRDITLVGAHGRRLSLGLRGGQISLRWGRASLPDDEGWPVFPSPDSLRVPGFVEALRSRLEEDELGGVLWAGYLARFAEPRSLAVLAGDPDPVGSALRSWWSDAPASRRDALPGRARARIERIGWELEELREETDPAELRWRARLEELRLERDELCSLLRVLRRFHPEALPETAMELLDEALLDLLRALPVALGPESPLLREVADRDAGWWPSEGGAR